jgi:hypothetical protein
MLDQITRIGKVDWRDDSRVFGLKRNDRRYHMLAIGRTGAGKSTLLGNLIKSDLANGQGISLFDPHGDLADTARASLPASRSDAVFFSPGLGDSNLTFNPLHVPRPELRHLVVSELITVFQHIWEKAWGPRLEYILKVVLLTLTEKPGYTLLDAMRMLNDKDFRDSVVKNLEDPILLEFWENEFTSYTKSHKSEAFAPIQNKLGEFAINPVLRKVIDHPTGNIDPRSIMDNGQVFIADLSVGRIGRDVAMLLGGTLIGKFALAALSRADTRPDARRDFYMYIDEFPMFATGSVDTMLSEARKYRLNLVLAMQYLDQLEPRILGSVLGNIGNLIVFRVGAKDASILAREFTPTFAAEDLVSIPYHKAYVRMMIDGVPSRPFSARMHRDAISLR